MWLGVKNVKIKRNENIFFSIFLPSLMRKTKRIRGKGTNMNKMKSSENIFPFYSFLAGKTRRGNFFNFAAEYTTLLRYKKRNNKRKESLIKTVLLKLLYTKLMPCRTCSVRLFVRLFVRVSFWSPFLLYSVILDYF